MVEQRPKGSLPFLSNITSNSSNSFYKQSGWWETINHIQLQTLSLFLWQWVRLWNLQNVGLTIEIKVHGTRDYQVTGRLPDNSSRPSPAEKC